MGKKFVYQRYPKRPSSEKVSSFQRKRGKTDPGSRNSGDNTEWIQNSVYGNSKSNQKSISISTESRRGGNDQHRGSGNATEGYNLERDRNLSRSIAEQPIFGGKKGRGKSSCDQSEGIEQIHSIQTFQNGRFALPEIHNTVQQNDYLCKVDLKDAYFSVPLHNNSRKFVRFLWLGNLYEFLCLCFGLGSAPRISSKLLQIPIAILRRINVRLIIFLDDILLMEKTLQEMSMSRDTLIFLLQRLGFVINQKKSVLQPTRQLEFLGMQIDTTNMCLFLTKEKLEKVTQKCWELYNHPKTNILELTRLIGLLSSTIQAVLPARIQLRYLEQQQILMLSQKKSYLSAITVNQEARTELLWWIENLRIWGGGEINPAELQMMIQTDASIQGWGAYCNSISTGGEMVQTRGHVAHKCPRVTSNKICTPDLYQGKIKSSNSLSGGQQDCFSILTQDRGTHSSQLLNISKEIWKYLLDKQIIITAEYLSSKLNVRADWESRNCRDMSDWKLDWGIFQKITRVRGFPEIDLFASRLCHQLPEYISWKPDPISIGTDAFQQP